MTVDTRALAEQCLAAARAIERRGETLRAQIAAVAAELSAVGGEQAEREMNERLEADLCAAVAARHAAASRLPPLASERADLERRAAETAENLARETGAIEQRLIDPTLLAMIPWARWLEDWSREHRVPLEPPGDAGTLRSRGAVDRVAAMVTATIDAHALAARKTAESAATIARAAAATADAGAIQADAAAALQRLDRFSVDGVRPRIVDDLPLPRPAPRGARQADTHAQLEQLLIYFDAVLGGFAASADLDSRMLDSHHWERGDGAR